MIYSVECGFAHPAREAEWNAFYSHDKLPALIAVPGFISSQRFRLLRGTHPPYLALHNITRADVLDSAHYRQQGGGNFARWQSDITDWRRNVYDGAPAPLVAAHEYLLLCDDAATAQRYGLQRLHAIALDRNPAERWIGTCAANQASAIPPDAPLHLYQALGEALRAQNG